MRWCRAIRRHSMAGRLSAWSSEPGMAAGGSEGELTTGCSAVGLEGTPLIEMTLLPHQDAKNRPVQPVGCNALFRHRPYGRIIAGGICLICFQGLHYLQWSDEIKNCA
jgi:hypothetical protein